MNIVLVIYWNIVIMLVLLCEVLVNWSYLLNNYSKLFISLVVCAPIISVVVSTIYIIKKK